MIHLPPAHLADTQGKLHLLFNGEMGGDTANPRLIFTCTQKPCVGASFDIPKDATAEDLENAYIAKRDQFARQKAANQCCDTWTGEQAVILTNDEALLLRNVLSSRLETYKELTMSEPSHSDRWNEKAMLTQSILNKLSK